jgi:hypothetical protein
MLDSTGGTAMRLTLSRSAGARLAIPLAAASISLVATSCTSAQAAHGSSRTGVITLNKISTLKKLFNRDNGHPRLVLIFSPT